MLNANTIPGTDDEHGSWNIHPEALEEVGERILVRDLKTGDVFTCVSGKRWKFSRWLKDNAGNVAVVSNLDTDGESYFAGCATVLRTEAGK